MSLYSFSSFPYLQGPEVDCGFQQGGVVFLQGTGASSCFSIVLRVCFCAVYVLCLVFVLGDCMELVSVWDNGRPLRLLDLNTSHA